MQPVFVCIRFVFTAYNNLFRPYRLLVNFTIWTFHSDSHCGIFSVHLPFFFIKTPIFTRSFFRKFALKMSQSADNTWSATEAKENQQEIAKLVSIFFSLCVYHYVHFFASLVMNSWKFFIVRHRTHFRWIICHCRGMVKSSQKMTALMLQSK